jgi:hypothetical protein
VLKTVRLVIEHNKLPQKYDKLGVRFERHTVEKAEAGGPTDMVLIRPAGALLSPDESVGPEPRWNDILCGMRLKAMDGTDVQGQGQLLITGQRLIGMIENGKATAGPPLSVGTSGNIFCFSCHRDDVYAPQVKKHRLMPSDFHFRSKEEQPVAFALLVFMAMGYVANDKVGYWHDKDMLRALSEEGRQGLLKSSS